LSLTNYPDFGRDVAQAGYGSALQIPLPKDAFTFAIENIIDMFSYRKHIVEQVRYCLVFSFQNGAMEL